MDEGFIDSGRAARVRAAAPLVDAHFAEALGELGAPGIAYGVAIDGELVHSGGCGVRDLAAGSAPDADTAFRICSMTKSFVAMVVLSLRDEGRLDIDAPVDEIAPDLRPLAEAGPDAPPVTVRQLLTMDAGLPQDDPWADRLMGHDNAWVSAEVFARGATRSRAPGTAFEYSNYGWAALGRVIEAVTGQRHQDVVRERVLRAARLALDGLERRRSAAGAGRDRVPRGRRRLRGGGAAVRRRLLLGARRPLQQRARPGALERGVPRRRTAARRARGGSREPRDAARDGARPQRVPARASNGRRWRTRPAWSPAATATAS